MSRTRFTVVMATFNGEQYLPEQLRSLAEQSRSPDEVLIIDDASTDRTWELLEAFASSAPFPVRLMRNERNVGYTRNFDRAVREASGELVALADQDDVWRSDKLERLERVFLAEPDVGLVASDAELVDDRLRPLGRSLWRALRLSAGERHALTNGGAFETLLRRNLVTGATCAFRTSFRDRIVPIHPGSVHDAWIALVIAASARFRLLPELLVGYRQHAGNQIGVRNIGALRRMRTPRQEQRAVLRKILAQHQALMERLESLEAVDPELLGRLADAVQHIELRLQLPRRAWPRARVVGREVARGAYHRWSRGWTSAARDLIG
jgi:glycosyltransferase involved in cell wall biosynthesis